MAVHTRAQRSHLKKPSRTRRSTQTRKRLNKRDVPSGRFDSNTNKQAARNRIREKKEINPTLMRDFYPGRASVRGTGEEKDTKNDEKLRDKEKLRKAKDIILKRKAKKGKKERQGVKQGERKGKGRQNN